MGSDVEIRLLGGFAVTIDSRLISAEDFERRSGALLVQVLALSGRRRLHREQVIDQLWPSSDLDRAANQLHKAASFARAALGSKDAIVVRDGHVDLLPEAAVLIDVDLLEAATADDPRTIDAAIEAYRGDLLPDVPYAEWALGERDRLRARFLDLLEAAGRWAELLAHDPTRESAHVKLMGQLLARGDRAGVLRRYDALAQILDRELGVEPGPEALELRRRAELGDLPAPVASSRRPMFGRDEECARVKSMLAANRLVTISGPGGVGKTHLADHVAQLAAAEGSIVHTARLAQVDNAAAVNQEVLSAIGGVVQGDTDAVESILRVLADRQALVVLDNAEHVLDPVRRLCADIGQRCARATIMVTTRTPIGDPDEHVLRLGPLSPSTAAELFCAEARRHEASIEATDAASETVARICARLDHLPLALRLAAARTRSLALDVLDSVLDERFELLVDSDTEVAAHQTLRATVAWSFDALDESQLDLLSQLAVFADRFDIDAAMAVVAPSTAAGMLVGLDELAGRSLVDVERSGSATEYRLLESIRLYARERGVGDETRRRHLVYYEQAAVDADEQLSRDSGDALDSFAKMWPDLRLGVAAATELGERERGLRIIAACTTYTNLVLQFEIVDWCEAIFGAVPETAGSAADAHALAAWASLITHRNEMAEARLITQVAAAAYGEIPAVLYTRAWIPWSAAELDEARRLLEQLIEHPTVPVSIEAGALTLLSVLLWAQGEDVGACAHRVEALAPGRGPLFDSEALITRAIADIWVDPAGALDALVRAQQVTDAHRLMTLGAVARAARGVALTVAGPIEAALEAIRENLEWTRANGFWNYAMAGLGTTAMALEVAGRVDRAITIVSARQANGFVAGFNAALIDTLVDRARSDHGDEFDVWWRSGQRLDPAATTALGIATIDEYLESASG